MFYQYTGQPGHGKTVLAIEFALEMKAKADKLHEQDPAKHPLRELYVCNVRDFNHGACGALDLTPDEVKGWHADPRFDHAIMLIDEAYEHGMFSRRPPGRPVPEHVQQVAKHRHRGIDFVMICQSPKKQMDDFLHDLIEEHYHIRRRYGLPFANVKRWDRFESNPDKAESLTTSRRRYPKHVFKLYTSTKYDTSEKRVPWFYWAAAALLAFVLIYGYMTASSTFSKFDPTAEKPKATTAAPTGGNGAAAKVPTGGAAFSRSDRVKWATTEEYIAAHIPRVAAMPWSAPAYDDASVTAQPQLYCMAAGEGMDGQGQSRGSSCACVTEQGTPYRILLEQCLTIARHGPPYNPYRRESGVAAVGGTMSGQVDQSFAPVGKQHPHVEPVGASTLINVGQRVNGSFPEQVQHRYGG
jgi:hypothetical protein